MSATRPGIETNGDPMEAAEPSPDSTEAASGRRGSTRRMKAAVTSPDSGGSRSGAGGPARVLRARGAGSGGTSESRNDPCTKKPTGLHRGRGRPAGLRSKHTPAVQ